jgi:hypothetical protein
MEEIKIFLDKPKMITIDEKVYSFKDPGAGWWINYFSRSKESIDLSSADFFFDWLAASSDQPREEFEKMPKKAFEACLDVSLDIMDVEGLRDFFGRMTLRVEKLTQKLQSQPSPT